MQNPNPPAPDASPSPGRTAPPRARRLTDRQRQLLCSALLLALLAGIVGLNRRTAARHAAADPGAAPAAEGLGPPGFRFEEVARAVGIDFRHQAPTLDPKLDHIMPLVASMGAGVAVADFDRDGWQDFFAPNSGEGSPSALYRNRGDGSFEDVAAPLGLAELNAPGSGVAMGAVWGDYDNDGFEDLFVYKWGRPELFRNAGGRRFERVTESAGLPGWVNANTALWLDYDRDGWLDLFIGGYYDERLDLWNLETTRMMPESFEYAENGGRKYLLRNLGDGRFEDVTEAMGIQSRRWALAAAAADLRGTGYPDLVVANDYGVSEYYANEGGRAFREVGRETGLAERPKSGMNVAMGDIFNQGEQAIYITNISAPGQLVQGNNLWVPVGAAEAGLTRFANMAEGLGVALGGWSFGAQFGDLNNDGAQDLFLTNGNVSQDPEASYWYDFGKIATGNEAIIADARNWPAIGRESLSGYEDKRVWINDGFGSFSNVAPTVGVTETFDGRAVALADFWNRGALDAVVAHQAGPLLLYRNTVAPERAWIGFELEGRASNRSAIGSQVRLRWGDREQLQEVSGGSGFAAQNQRRLHFGLGAAQAVDSVEIRWPSGQRQVLTAPALNRYHRLVEPEGPPPGAE